MEVQTKNFIKYIILPLIVAAGLVVYFIKQNEPDWRMHLNFYDVGQGDSFLIRTYQGNQILVDGGPGTKVLEGLGADLSFQDKIIEMVILTHPHADHYEGLIEVFKRYKVEKLLMPNVEYDSSSYKQFIQVVKNESSEIIYVKQGQRIFLDSATVLDILHPTSQDVATPKKSDEVNDSSIVARLSFGKTKMLFTGDAGTNIESELLNRFNLDSNLLKIGHHGSKHSTSKKFLLAITPEFSVIQVGKNSYGHPAPQVLSALGEIKSQVFRTDVDKTIRFTSDGTSIVVNK